MNMPCCIHSRLPSFKHSAPRIFAAVLGVALMNSEGQAVVTPQPCNCGTPTVVARGIPGGAVTAASLTAGTGEGNPVEVELLPDQEVQLGVTIEWDDEMAPYSCGQAYATFPTCTIEYQTHNTGDDENTWGPWTTGDRFALGLVPTGEDTWGPELDAFRLRITAPASDTADDPTGSAAGAATGSGRIGTAHPTMSWQAGTPPTASLVPPGATLSIPMGPVGLGTDNTAPFRSAGTLSVKGVLAPALAAPSNVTRHSISEMSELVSEAGVSDQTGQVEKHFITPAKVFRLRGWDTATEEWEPMHSSAGSLVEEYAAGQYDYDPENNTGEFSGNPRASWRIEPVETEDDGEGIRMTRTVNGITTVETALVEDSGHTLVTEANGTRTSVTLVPDTADTYTEEVSRQTDGVNMAGELRTYSRFQWGYEMTGRVIDPEGENLVHLLGYHESSVDQDGNAADPASHRRIKYRSEPDGNWALYSYPGGATEVLSPFCSETVPNGTFTAVVSTGGSSPGRHVRSLEEVPMDESVDSVHSARQLWQGTSMVATLSDSSTTVEDITTPAVRVSTASTWRDASDDVSETRITHSPSLSGADAWLAGKPLLEVEPSGRATHHVWSRDEQGNVVHTETTGLADKSEGGTAVADGWHFHEVESASTRTITATGPDGILERVAQHHTGSGFTTAYTEAYSYGDDTWLDEVSVNGTPVRTFSYPSPLITVTTEAGSGTTRVETDSRGRTLNSSLMVPGTPPLTTTWDYDGLTTTTRLNGRVEETTVTDTLGRTVSRTDRIGATTTMEYTGGGSIVTETGPGDVERVTTSHFDGRPASLTGDLVPRFHSYDIITEGGESRLATTVAEDDEGSRRVTTVVNRDGSVHQTIRPTFEDAGTVAETRTYHAGSDRLARIDSTAPHTPPRLFPVGESALEQFGAQTTTGLDGQTDPGPPEDPDESYGVLILADPLDRITRTTQTHEAVNGSVVRVTVEETFPEPGSDVPYTVTRRETLTPAACSVQGLGDGLARVEQTITPGAGTAVRTLTRTTKNFAGAVVVEDDDSATTVSPDSSTTYVAGRPVSRTIPGATTTETWEYDGAPEILVGG